MNNGKNSESYIVCDINRGYVYLSTLLIFPVNKDEVVQVADFSTNLNPEESTISISEEPILVSIADVTEIKLRYRELVLTDLEIYRLVLVT
jgi:hypothetical protein